MATRTKRAALYVRVSTDHQTVENQVSERRAVAERRGWEVLETYRDAGISGAKGRDKRPGLDGMLNDVSRRKFDVIMVWAIDRLGRSLIDLLGTIQHLETVGVDLYLEQQHLDTTTPTGKLLFQITGAFAEFEHNMIAPVSAPVFQSVRRPSSQLTERAVNFIVKEAAERAGVNPTASIHWLRHAARRLRSRRRLEACHQLRRGDEVSRSRVPPVMTRQIG